MTCDMKEEIEEIFSEIEKFEDEISKSELGKKEAFRNRISSRFFFYVGLGPFVASVIILLLLYCFKGPKIFFLSPLVLISIGYIGIVVSNIAYIVEERKDLKMFFKNPVKMILGNIRNESVVDMDLFKSIVDKSTSSLVYIKEHIENERIHFERRLGILVGALEKIGLIPGLATLYFAWAKAGESGPFSIQTGTAISVFSLYLLAVYYHLQFGRLDRYIRTFSVAIEHRSSLERLNGLSSVASLNKSELMELVALQVKEAIEDT